MGQNVKKRKKIKQKESILDGDSIIKVFFKIFLNIKRMRI